MDKKETTNLKSLLVPGAFGLILIVLAIIALSTMKGVWDDTNTRLLDVTHQSQVLEEKVSVLRQVDEAVKDNAVSVYLALPSKNPSAQIVSQIKNKAQAHFVSVDQLQVYSASTEGTDISKITIDVDASGTGANILAFLVDLKNLSPVLNIELVESTSGVTGLVRASISSYWAPLPDTLPAITDTVEPITESELNLLRLVSALEQPQFSEGVGVEATESAREKPFVVTGVELEEDN
jgi:hypothetical protein